MLKREMTLSNRFGGIHFRPAARLCNLIDRFRAEIVVECKGERINGKDMMDWLMLPAAPGTFLTVYADGPDEAEALDAIQKLIENNKFFER